MRLPLVVLLSFFGVALIAAWPLPLHLGTHLTADPAGDAGVYIWNTWVFGHELSQGHSPFRTTAILPLSGAVDLSLHNYTVFADLLALPLQAALGVVAAFNIVYLINFALAGLGMFLLISHVQRSSSGGTVEAWLGALIFACSPFLVARGNGHFSLAAAAPLPFFVLCFDRTLSRGRWTDSLGAGVSAAWAAYCDPYYAIYCAMLGTFLVAMRIVEMRVSRRSTRGRLVAMLDAMIVLIVGLVVVVHATGGGAVDLGPIAISIRSVYSPTLVATAALVVRLLMTWRINSTWYWRRAAAFISPVLIAIAIAGVLLAPELVAMGQRAAEGQMVDVPVMWRSSAPGVDVAAFLLPNPNHPWTPASIVSWIRRQPGENIASIPLIALTILGVAWWRAGYRPDRAWMAMSVIFLSLALGPFIRVAGVQTGIPTPWTFLRYLPAIGEARMPARFSVIVIMAVAVMCAGAVAALRRRYPQHRRMVIALVSAALAFELWSAPRPLYSAEIPAVYAAIARDARPMRVLDLPFGVHDGLTASKFNPATLFYQTSHHKPVVGGYLSRLSDAEKAAHLDHPLLGALAKVSEGRELTDLERAHAIAAGPDFVHDIQLGWVVIDEARSSPALVALATDALGLTLRGRERGFSVHVPSAR